jgi:hypothetical protein
MEPLTRLPGRYEKLFREMQRRVKMSGARSRQFILLSVFDVTQEVLIKQPHLG